MSDSCVSYTRKIVTTLIRRNRLLCESRERESAATIIRRFVYRVEHKRVQMSGRPCPGEIGVSVESGFNSLRKNWKKLLETIRLSKDSYRSSCCSDTMNESILLLIRTSTRYSCTMP